MSSDHDLATARFSQEAASWDANKTHADDVTKAFEAIKHHVPAFAEERSKGAKHQFHHHA